MKKKETKKKRAGNLRNNEREKKVNWDFVKQRAERKGVERKINNKNRLHQ